MSRSRSRRRFAIYWAPDAAHALWRAGCDWLGRDPERPAGRDGEPALARPEDWPTYRTQPRRYGFHATLKPPFVLRDDGTDADLEAAIEALARGRAAFELPELAVTTLGHFIALRPREPQAIGAGHPLRQLADACVRELDAFRGPPALAERARRSALAGLTPVERDHLARWGYPWVFDQWRFHLTLSDNLTDDEAGRAVRERLLADARLRFAEALARPLVCDAVALFVEDGPGAAFRLQRRFPFGA